VCVTHVCGVRRMCVACDAMMCDACVCNVRRMWCNACVCDPCVCGLTPITEYIGVTLAQEWPGGQLITFSFLFQNMVFLGKIIPPSQELTKSLRAVAKSDEPPTKEQLAQWYTLAKTVSKHEHERLFVIMTAQEKGWTFARDLDFYQNGDEADPNYMKVAKKHAKRELQERDARASKKSKGPRYGSSSYGASRSYGAPQASSSHHLGGYGAGPSSAPSRGFNRKDTMRCNICAEFGHFARECRKPPPPK
jgi:hypothetical protein